MNIGHKLLLTFSCIALFIVVTDFFIFSGSKNALNTFNKSNERQIPLLISSLEIMSAARQASIKAVEYSLRQQNRDKIKAMEALSKVHDNFTLIEESLGDRATSDRLSQLIHTFEKAVRDYLLIVEGEADMTFFSRQEEDIHESRRQLIHFLYELRDLVKERLSATLEETTRHFHRIATLIAVLAFLVFSLVILCGVYIARSISRPIERLKDAAGRLSAGQLETRIHLNSNDEIGQLGESFNKMADELQRHHEHLEALVLNRTMDLENINRELQTKIEELIKTQQELYESRANLAEAQRIAHLGSWEYNFADNRFFWTEEISRLFEVEHLERDGATFADFLDIVHPQDRDRVERAFREAVSEHRKYDVSYRLLFADGRVKHVHAQGKTHYDDQGTPLLCRGTGHDISRLIEAEEEKKTIEKQLRQTQKMEAIGTLAGGIAHDFNNILTPIIGYTDIVLSKLPADSPERKDLQEVARAGRRAKDLVLQILTFSRQGEDEHHPLQVAPIVKEAMKLLRSTIPTTIEMRQHIRPDNGYVLASPTQIHQIVMNLCTNAYHAMRERGGLLSVSLTSTKIGGNENPQLGPGSYLKLEITDNGHGIPAELQERIFEPYFTTKRHEEGTGLGLSVVHGIVKTLHGHISLVSEEGKGSSFFVYLPTIETDILGRQMESLLDIPQGDEHLLLVDDEESVLEPQEMVLTSLGYRVTTCTSGAEALRLFESRPDDFDLVITDMTMPAMTGLALSLSILHLKPTMPIILCTGFSELINEKKAREAGIRKFLMKPVGRRGLALAVREVLDNPAGDGP